MTYTVSGGALNSAQPAQPAHPETRSSRRQKPRKNRGGHRPKWVRDISQCYSKYNAAFTRLLVTMPVTDDCLNAGAGRIRCGLQPVNGQDVFNRQLADTRRSAGWKRQRHSVTGLKRSERPHVRLRDAVVIRVYTVGHKKHTKILLS